MTIHRAIPADILRIVKVHIASFPGFFLTFLGPRFLRLLYTALMERDGGVLLVAKKDAQVAGFVGGVLKQQGFYSQLVKQHKWRFGISCFAAIAKRPRIVPRLFRALRRSSEAKQSAAQACLMSIGVDPTIQGKGIGRALVTAFCEELRKKGCPSVCLTTDKVDNEKTNCFYQGLGFSIAREYTTPEGREMYEYVKSL